MSIDRSSSVIACQSDQFDWTVMTTALSCSIPILPFSSIAIHEFTIEQVTLVLKNKYSNHIIFCIYRENDI
jgi:hypothetical protein